MRELWYWLLACWAAIWFGLAGGLVSQPYAQDAIIRPTNQITFSLTPVVSTAAEATHILSPNAANVYTVYFTNHTATSGYLILIDATAVPSDGAVVPKGCAAFSGNASASINYIPGPMGAFQTGVVAIASSSSSCFTKTTGTVTGFFSGLVK